MGNSAAVHGLRRRSRPITPSGSQPPCGAGQRLHPSPSHYRTAFASSRLPYRLRPSLCLRSGDFGDLRLAPPRRAHPAYHVRRVAPTSRVRMPLYTGRVDGCVGSPLKLPDLPSVPFWLWGRMVARAPPASRCVTPRLQLPYPCRPFPDGETVCHAQRIALPRAWDPAVASDAPPVREQMAPHQARSQFLCLSLAVKLATSCRNNGQVELLATGDKRS
jgi:hypothetical protein